MTKNFYSGLDAHAFWRTGVAESNPFEPKDLYQKKWEIKPNWKIGTAGSCFAQHIARYLRKYGYNVLDAEPAPMALPENRWKDFGYGMYSARYGNIYTTRQFLQLIQEAFSVMPSEPLIWKKDGRYFDAIRPNIEPNGFSSPEELLSARRYHLERLGFLFKSVDMFVFTLGLTEAWVHRDSGCVVPIAPGIIAGSEVIDDYAFINFNYEEVVSDFRKAMRLINENRNRRLHFMLTVSPVPLTATATSSHVLSATNYSKSVLRSAAGDLCGAHSFIDYFPSYEIITNPASRGIFFDTNLRSVRDQGVEIVMASFFAQHPPRSNDHSKDKRSGHGVASSNEAVQCEEALLEAFRK